LVLGGLGWLVVVIVAVFQARATIAAPGVGLDLRPVRDAGLAVRSGHSIYDVPMFVYMPYTALVGVLLSLVSWHGAVVGYAYLEYAILASAVFLMRGALGRSRWTLLAAALIAAALLEGDLVVRDARLENISVLMVLPCVGIVLCWGTGRWRWGAVILAATLLIKPMLIALLVVPLLARRWTATALTVAVTAVLCVLALPLVPSVGAALKIADRVLKGSNLTGAMSVYNLSLWGWGHTHHTPTVVVVGGRLLVVVVAVACLAVVWRREQPMTVATVGPLAGLLLGATFLAGSLSENHYLLVLLPVAFTCLIATSVASRLLVVGAVVLAAYSHHYTTILGTSASAIQTRFVVIELLLFVASALALLGTHDAPGDGDSSITRALDASTTP
jgi:hypothetical protein